MDCNLRGVYFLLMMKVFHWEFTVNKHDVASRCNDDPIIQDQHISNGLIIWKKEQFSCLLLSGKKLLLAYEIIVQNISL
jgi:hypothetical protein